MQNKSRIPRWLIESDPSWEKTIDSNLGMLKWTNKATGIQATCPPTSMFCDILGQDEVQTGLSDDITASKMMNRNNQFLQSGASDITKYLSSRYLNPGINGPNLDLKRTRRF